MIDWVKHFEKILEDTWVHCNNIIDESTNNKIYCKDCPIVNYCKKRIYFGGMIDLIEKRKMLKEYIVLEKLKRLYGK